jgi:hypothetical protein
MTVRETMARMQEDLRRAALAGRGAEEMRSDLKQRKAKGRVFSVEQDGVEYFPIYALDPDAGTGRTLLWPKRSASSTKPKAGAAAGRWPPGSSA